MHLEPHGPDVFVGESWRYPWGRVYGGQVVAQALSAAAETVDPDYLPHSLHAYFIRGGTSDEPIRYEVDRIRNGRSRWSPGAGRGRNHHPEHAGRSIGFPVDTK